MNVAPSTGWQAGFLTVLPAVQTHAQIQFRRLPAEQRAEAVQEAIAAACVSYRLLAAKGRLHVASPGTLATFAVNHVRNGRHIGGRQDNLRDVMSPACQRQHGLQVNSLHVRRAKGDSDDWRQMAIAERKDPIPDTAAFRIDFARWLRALTHRDRKMVRAFICGDRTSDVAGRFGITLGRVSQLRRRYEAAWRRFHGESDDQA